MFCIISNPEWNNLLFQQLVRMQSLLKSGTHILSKRGCQPFSITGRSGAPHLHLHASNFEPTGGCSPCLVHCRIKELATIAVIQTSFLKLSSYKKERVWHTSFKNKVQLNSEYKLICNELNLPKSEIDFFKFHQYCFSNTSLFTWILDNKHVTRAEMFL